MTPNKQHEAAAMQVYEAYWDSYLKGDMKTMATFLDEHIKVIGSTEAEVFFNKKEALEFYEPTADQIAGKAELRNRIIKVEPVDGLLLITEQADFYMLIDGNWTFYSKARLSSLLQQKKDGWKLIQQHGSLPDTRAEEGEQVAVEKISKENFELRDAIKRRTIELEQKNDELLLESCLERVRAIAMGMRTPGDLLNICETMFSELKAMGFDELRNAMINIHDDAHQSFLNYDYSDDAGKTITHHFYNSHPVIENQVKQIRSSKDAFSETVFAGKDLADWKKFRKEKGEKDDPKVEDIQALYYYFYSIGTGAIGISTYRSISAGKRLVLKKFRNVFDFAYQRYMDVALAEAQAKEAQIELALEKVRARTMAMQHSDELKDAAILLFDQLKGLGVQTGSCGFNIWNKKEKTATAWMSSAEGGLQTAFELPHTESAVYLQVYEAMKKGEDFLVKELAGNNLNKHFDYLCSLPGIGEVINNLRKSGYGFPETIVFHFAFFAQGYLSFHLHEHHPETHELFKRFAKVFEQTYTRFLDLQKAEAQAKEAEIQLALERVRARSLAMHHTAELQEVVDIVAKQLHYIGLDINGGVIITINEEVDEDLPLWASSGAADYVQKVVVPFFDRPIYIHLRDAIKKRNNFFEEAYSKNEKDEMFKHLFNYAPWNAAPDERKKELYSREGGLARAAAIAQHTSIAITNHNGIKFSDAEKEILKRFGNIFEQAYTRFLDLQKAEAQAREAHIELVLERVRARTMAMHRSEELRDVINLVAEQLQQLNFSIDTASFSLNYKEYPFNVWMAAPGQPYPTEINIPLVDITIMNRINEVISNGLDAYSETFNKEEKDEWIQHVLNTTIIKHAPEERKKFLLDAAGISVSIVLLKHTSLIIGNYASIPYTNEENAILKRFANVFEQTYTRFLDLQKAEAQAREAKIEAALERTRTQSMLMQHSTELDNTLRVFHEQVLLLGIDSAFSFLWLPDEDKERHIFWAAWSENDSTDPLAKNGSIVFNSKSINYPLDRNEPATAQCLIDWKGSEPVVSYQVAPSGVENYFAAWQDLIEGVAQLKPEYFSDGLYYVEAFMKYGCFGVMVKSELPEAEKKILYRFTNEFERAYTRFLDLQKAEAQAREAQIEAALERVRSRSMGMQKSEELKAVIKIVYQQLAHLKIKLDHAGFVVDYTPGGDWHFWIADEQDIPAQITHPYFESVWANQFNEAKEKGAAFFATHLNFEEKNHFYNELLSYVPGLPEASKDFYLSCPGLAASTILSEHVALYIENFAGIPYSDEENNTLIRFGKVFQQTYTRFLDLQKAEAQAREAQIETGLERVRSRSLAMHNTSELQEVIHTVHKELLNLNIAISGGSFIAINNDIQTALRCWGSGGTADNSEEVILPIYEKPFCTNLINGIKKGSGFFTEEYTRQEKLEFFTFLFKHHPWSNLDSKKQQETLSSPGGYTRSCCVSQNTSIFIINHFGKIFSEDENEILKRFAKVFEQAYTRFLDLQKAEAQAKEARIETALERVRSRTLAMQQSAELGEVATELFKQMNQLVDNLWTGGFVLCEKNRAEDEWWLSSESGFIPAFFLPNTGNRVHENLYTGWKNEENFRAEQVEGAELEQHYEWLMNIPVAKKIFEDMAAAGYPRPVWQKLHAAYFSKGYLVIITQVPCSEEIIFKRFAQVFDLTYTRFLDLQNAELRTHQAKIETALEKVRARALAMQQPEELTEVAQVMRHEMGLLGVEELETSSIYIHEEDTDKAECWYAIKDIRVPEKKLVADHFVLNMQDTWVGRQMLAFYQSTEKRISIPMQGANRLEWINYCSGQSKLLEGFYGDQIPDRTYHLYKFSSGTIGAATPGNISAESWDLLQRAASVFSLAYSRFKDLTQARIDLQRLKEEKQRAETALTELQLTQKQLIQAEKMASLGELTAGIAHEIQNPLNFVNNFSEVSKELLDEMKEAIDKGDTDDAKEIMNDVIQNLEKINHHGKRADAIVKGMLQHSGSSSGTKEPTDINALCNEFLRLSYHGLRAKDKSFNATLKTDFDESIGSINIVPQDIGRVLLNLINNAFHATQEKKKLSGDQYEPVVTVSSSLPPPSGGRGAGISISVKDNGPGIPQKILDKIFQPFFTTKPTGQGTGLGLSLSYDIVKAHGGELKVETTEGEGTTFIVTLPIV